MSEIETLYFYFQDSLDKKYYIAEEKDDSPGIKGNWFEISGDEIINYSRSGIGNVTYTTNKYIERLRKEGFF